MAAGARLFLCTDISRDGMLGGVALDLYKRLQDSHDGICLIASGGVAGMEDIHAVKALNMFGVVVGKAIYEGKISLNELFDN